MIRRRFALLLLLPLLLTLAFVSPTYANHTDGDQGGTYYCYQWDKHVSEHTDWYSNEWGWRTHTYERYEECTYDGSWYWNTYLYTWYYSYWVQSI